MAEKKEFWEGFCMDFQQNLTEEKFEEWKKHKDIVSDLSGSYATFMYVSPAGAISYRHGWQDCLGGFAGLTNYNHAIIPLPLRQLRNNYKFKTMEEVHERIRTWQKISYEAGYDFQYFGCGMVLRSDMSNGGGGNGYIPCALIKVDRKDCVSSTHAQGISQLVRMLHYGTLSSKVTEAIRLYDGGFSASNALWLVRNFGGQNARLCFLSGNGVNALTIGHPQSREELLELMKQPVSDNYGTWTGTLSSLHFILQGHTNYSYYSNIDVLFNRQHNNLRSIIGAIANAKMTKLKKLINNAQLREANKLLEDFTKELSDLTKNDKTGLLMRKFQNLGGSVPVELSRYANLNNVICNANSPLGRLYKKKLNL